MTSEHPIHMEIVCPECSYSGLSPMSMGDGPRVVTCPECHEEWIVESARPEEEAP